MCSRTKLLNAGREDLLKDEISIDLFKQWFSPEFIRQLDSLHMCGNLGDPIVAADTLEIFSYLREHKRSIKLKMFTNASARDDAWWKRLAQLRVKTIFSIDGLEDTNKLYRINTSWEKIMNNAEVFISSGGVALWYMVVFEHNEHQIEECRALAKKMKFTEFQPRHTARFKLGQDELHVYDNNGKYTHTLKPTEISKNLRENNKLITAKDDISCKAGINKSIYVSAAGVVTPCCWTESSKWENVPRTNDYLSRIGNFYSLHNHSISEIFNTGSLNNIKNTWGYNPLQACSAQCGSYKRCAAQFVEKNKDITIIPASGV
jgi:hypothetical protein